MSLPKLSPLPFIFVRHGETFYNFEKRVAGSRNVPLTPKGEAQALNAHQVLADITDPFVVSSTLDRAIKTARIAMPDHTPVTLAGLCERDWGPLQGHAIPERMPYVESVEGVESWHDFQTRVINAINEAQRLAEGRTVVIFAHAGVFRVVRMATQGHLEGKRLPNASPVQLRPPKVSSEAWDMVPLQPEDWA